jgi:hypothetical protein
MPRAVVRIYQRRIHRWVGIWRPSTTSASMGVPPKPPPPPLTLEEEEEGKGAGLKEEEEEAAPPTLQSWLRHCIIPYV